MSERAPGFYWTKCGEKWIVEEWDGHYWWMTGSEESGEDYPELVVGPKIEPPA